MYPHDCLRRRDVIVLKYWLYKSVLGDFWQLFITAKSIKFSQYMFFLLKLEVVF